MSQQEGSRLSEAIYSCNVEFHGRDFASIRRVDLCRKGAEFTYQLFQKDGRLTKRKQIPLNRQDTLTSQGVILCKNEFDLDGERGACIQGVMYFAKAYLKWASPEIKGGSSSAASPKADVSAEPSAPVRPWVDDSEYL